MDPLAANRNGDECYAEHPQRNDGGIGIDMMKRNTFGHHRHAGDPMTAEGETSPTPAAAGILRRGRFAPQSISDMSPSSYERYACTNYYQI